jgi:hypothetical protein
VNDALMPLARSNGLLTFRHPGEKPAPGLNRGRGPVSRGTRDWKDWIPASAGMTVLGCRGADRFS